MASEAGVRKEAVRYGLRRQRVAMPVAVAAVAVTTASVPVSAFAPLAATRAAPALRLRGLATGPRMQMQLPDPQKKARGSQESNRPFSPPPLQYKADLDPRALKVLERESAQDTGDVQALAPLDWTGAPVDSFRRLFSDYAPRMTEKEAFVWLVAVVALCGVNFPLTSFVGQSIDGPALLTARFAIASAFFLPWFGEIEKKMLVPGLETGLWLSAGYIAQAVCLTGGTNSGVASFFASMSCVLCPFFERYVGVQLGWRAWAAAAIGLLSAFVLEVGPSILGDAAGGGGAGGGGMVVGARASDLVAILQPFFFGLYLFRTERVMGRMPEAAMPITALQVWRDPAFTKMCLFVSVSLSVSLSVCMYT